MRKMFLFISAETKQIGFSGGTHVYGQRKSEVSKISYSVLDYMKIYRHQNFLNYNHITGQPAL